MMITQRTRFAHILYVRQAKDKMDYTHFLSIPLTPIKDKVKQWQDEIIQKYTPGSHTVAYYAHPQRKRCPHANLDSCYVSFLVCCVCGVENTRGFDPSILLAPEKMHLTVLMLKLFSAQEINKAKELLKQASAQVYDLLGSRYCHHPPLLRSPCENREHTPHTRTTHTNHRAHVADCELPADQRWCDCRAWTS